MGEESIRQQGYGQTSGQADRQSGENRLIVAWPLMAVDGHDERIDSPGSRRAHPAHQVNQITPSTSRTDASECFSCSSLPFDADDKVSLFAKNAEARPRTDQERCKEQGLGVRTDVLSPDHPV